MRRLLLASTLSGVFALVAPVLAQTPTTTSTPSVDKPAAAAANTPPAPAAPAAPTATPAPPPPPPAPPAPPPPAPPPPAPAPEPPAKKPAMMMMKKSEPKSGTSSHITSSDTKGDIAPKLPSPKLGPDASPEDYLAAAKTALKAKKTGEAQESLEMAETRLLDRSTAVDDAGKPDAGPKVSAIHDALAALAKKDYKGADMSIDTAMGGKHMMPKPMDKPMHHKMKMPPKPATPAS